MSAPSYTEYVTAVRREGEAIVSASAQGAGDAVPTCPGWTIADLCRHLGKIYAYVATVVGERLTSAPDRSSAPAADDADPLRFVAASLDDLVDALSGCEASTPVWNWAATQPDEAVFWARRMAHESAVHRFDAQRAFGVAQPIDTELAIDGMDELVDVVAPRVAERDAVALPGATYRFDAGAGLVWQVRLDDDGVRRMDAAGAVDVTVRGTPSALLLSACNRVPWTSLEVDGAESALTAWSSALRF